MNTTKVRCDCGSMLLVKSSAIGRNVHCPRCGQAWSVTARDFPVASAATGAASAAPARRKPRRELLLALLLIGVIGSLGAAWGLTRNRRAWQDDLITPGPAVDPSPSSLSPVSPSSRSMVKPAVKVATTKTPAVKEAAESEQGTVPPFDGLGNASAPSKVEASKPAASQPASSTPGVAKAADSKGRVAVKSSGEADAVPPAPDVKPDGFDPGRPLPPAPASSQPAVRGPDAGQGQQGEGMRPSRRGGDRGEGGEGREGRGPGRGGPGRGGPGRGGEGGGRVE